MKHYLIRFIIGDYEGLGHNLKKSVYISSTLSPTEFNEYLDKIEECTGINLDELCEASDDNRMSERLVDFLNLVNFQNSRDDFYSYDKTIDDENMFMDIVLFLLKYTIRNQCSIHCEDEPEISIIDSHLIAVIDRPWGYGTFKLK